MRPFDAVAGRLLFRPSRHPIACTKRRDLIRNGRRNSEVWIDPAAAEPELFVLRFLGARGRAEQGMRDPVNRFDPFPGEVWIANPPGFGATSGRTSPADYLEDALAVFDALEFRAQGRPIWVQGQSLGTLAALHVTASRSPEWLILRNATPAALVARRWLGPLAWLFSGLLPKGFDALHSAGKSRADALFVTSLQDRIATPALQARVYAAYAGPKQQLHVNSQHQDHVLSDPDEANYRQIIGDRLRSMGLA